MTEVNNFTGNPDIDRWIALGNQAINQGAGRVWMPNGQLVPQGQVLGYFNNLFLGTGKDREDYFRMADLLIDKGYMSNRADISGWQTWMGIAVDTAGQEKYRSQKLTPLDIVELLPSSSGGSGEGDGTKTSSSTSRSINLSNRGDAKTSLNNAYEQMLGRRANDKELAAFQKALNDLESKNASVTTQTGTSTSKGDSSSSSFVTKTTGGFNAAQFAEDWARSRPEYAENFAATTFMSVIDNMTRGGASLEGRV